MEKRLNALQVAKLTEPGRHCDGGNLNLSITVTRKGTLSKRWTFLYAYHGKQHELGLGSAKRVSLAQARAKAAKARELLDRGIDPLANKTAPGAPAVTFRARANEYIESKGAEWNPTHLWQWRRTINDQLAPIGDMPVGMICTQTILEVLTPIWKMTPVTAMRIRGRIEAVLDSATALGLRSGPNPAAWRNHLALILPGRGRNEQVHHAAMPYHTVAGFVRDLRSIATTVAKALEFTILTAARSGEAIGARWDEIDLDAKVWTMPASRMKAGIEHRVPLSGRAIEILEEQAAHRCGDLVFPGRSVNQPLGKTALWKLCPPGVTVHGFRSSFRDWCGNETATPREVAEAALAHRSGDSTEQAYRRSDALARRRKLMDEWASYCEPAPAAGVVPMVRRG